MSNYNVVVRVDDAKYEFRRVLDDNTMLNMTEVNGKLYDNKGREYLLEYTAVTANKAKKLAHLGNKRVEMASKYLNKTLKATTRGSTISFN